MKHVRLLLILLTLAVVAGCAGTLHKPTTACNAGTSALVAYASAGFTAGKYLALPTCAAVAVYPCKTPDVVAKIDLADTAAYNAAKAADAACNPNLASDQLAALKAVSDSREVSSQVQLKMGESK